ncbi:PLDc N-terminal domain-containing protein [Porphyromonas uenonis]|uniref:PLDc N-terminal domain-containing protein n=1 Tax=Porphyromonas uenonis TaxID=281920 RepID=UPI001EE36FEB|nr:PLDc N-terminal domain-containing protein [Porphyromonas uenonis]
MWTILLTILYTLLVVGVVVVILTGGDDIYRMFSWLMVVLFIPIVGVILYLLFGRSTAPCG